MLESKEVTKVFGSKTAVDHVSLKLEKGHVCAMLGPNGSGKTTWMKMAAGLIKPTSGQVFFNVFSFSMMPGSSLSRTCALPVQSMV